MPSHFFWECLRLEHSTAVRADISQQNFCICPRYWYVDATFQCSRCNERFCFTVAEQKLWYEELGFYVDSYARNCLACRQDARRQKQIRKKYDGQVANALESDDVILKKQICDVIDELCGEFSELPKRIHQNRETLAKQIRKLTPQSDDTDQS